MFAKVLSVLPGVALSLSAVAAGCQASDIKIDIRQTKDVRHTTILKIRFKTGVVRQS